MEGRRTKKDSKGSHRNKSTQSGPLHPFAKCCKHVSVFPSLDPACL